MGCLSHLISEYQTSGYVIAREVFETGPFDSFIQEIENITTNHRSPEHGEGALDSLDIYYEADGITIKKCEKLLYSYPNLKAFVENNEIIRAFMKEVFQDDFVLFKDKLNPKYANKGSGWKMHVDGVFYSDTATKGWWDYASEFINILIPFDRTSLENGALQIRPLDPDRCTYEDLLQMTDENINNGIPKEEYYDELVKGMVPVLLVKGDVAFFDPRCYHMSSSNKSSVDRKVLYLTYNKLSDGDNYMRYFNDKVSSTHLGDHTSGDWQRVADE